MSKGSALDFLAGRLGFAQERTVTFGDGENDLDLVAWGGYGVAVENADPRVKEVARWVCPPAAEEGAGCRDRGACRLSDMIDLRAARDDPERFRAALARKGAAERFDALLAADERWRALLPRVEELRDAAEAEGQADAGAARGAEPREGGAARRSRRSSRPPRPSATSCSTQVPNPPDPTAPDGDTDEDAEEVRRVGRARARGARAHRRSGGSSWSARPGSRARASATSRATRRSSRWRSTASRSTARRRTATRR